MILHGRTPMCAQVTCSKNLSPLFHEKSCLFFIFKFHLLPFDTTSRSLGSQLQPVLANRHGNLTPARISGRRPHCGSLLRGAVTGRKYHYRLHRSLRDTPAMEHFQDRHVSLGTFDAILLTGTLTACRWSWRVLLRRFALSRCTANVL